MAGKSRATSGAAVPTALLAVTCACTSWSCGGSGDRVVSTAAQRPLRLPTGPASLAPRLASFGERVVLSWIENGPTGPELKFSIRNRDAWGPARTVTSDRRIACDAMDVSGVVPLADGSLAAHWTRRGDGPPHAREVLVSESRDSGETWSAQVRPHRNSLPSSRGMATVVPRANGNRFDIVWLDARAGEQSDYGEGGTALYQASWDGRGFGAETVLDPRVCDCCKTAAAPGPSGPIVAYRGRRPGERRDISVVSEVGGRWTQPSPVGDDGWTITACPTNGPAIAARGERVAVAWFTAAGGVPSVRVALSRDAGRSFTPGVRIDDGRPLGRVDADLFEDGSAVVVWLEREGGSALVRLRRVAGGGPLGASTTVATTGASRTSGYPRVMTDGARDAIVVWTDTLKGASRVAGAEVTIP